MRMKSIRWLASLLVLIAPAAHASFHLMSIREVYAGSVAKPNSQYVQLQMRSSGQNFVGGHSVEIYDAAGTRIAQFTFSGSVLESGNQAFILVATPDAEAEFGVTADLAMTPALARRGGRVCFDTVDCFAWGHYTGPANRCGGTSSDNLCITGTPFRATEGLASGRAARRDISAGDPNLLEPNNNIVDANGAGGDDTGDSARDFDYAPDPRPTNNAGTSASAPAVGTGIDLADFTKVGALRLSRKGPIAEGGVLHLTPVENPPARASVWHRLRQPVANGFDTTFKFRITPSETPSEGFAFLIQNESNSSLGAGGGRLGYDGITNGVAIEFDTRRSAAAEIGVGDPVGNRVGIHTRGEAANSASEAASLQTSSSLPTLNDGGVHTARVRYTPGTPGKLAVSVDATSVVQVRIDLSNRLDLTNGAAFVGFTSGSGKGIGSNDILSWKLTSTP